MLSSNSGCRWMEFTWNGIETVVMENDLLRIEILAGKGSDIVEFLYKPSDIDFMWRSPFPVYNPACFVSTAEGGAGNFLDFYPGGWQEILPNGGGPAEYKGAVFGLHGEVALIPWKYRIVEETPEKISIMFHTRTYRTSFLLEKTLTLEKGSPALCIDEKVTNTAGEDMDFIWGHHPALGKPFLSSDCTIKIKKAKITVAGGDGKSFTNLKQVSGDWPFVEGTGGENVDISSCPSDKDRVSDVIFLSGLQEGRYEIFNNRLGIGFALEFPVDIFRYLWFWRVAGGSFHYPWYGRTYNIALEPFSSLPVLSEAVKRGDHLTLRSGASMTARIKAAVTTPQNAG